MQKQSNGEAMLDGVPVGPLTGVYWDLLAPFDAKDLHNAMAEAIKGRSKIELLTATVYDRDSCAPCGRFDVAVDPSSGDGCGIYRSILLVQETGDVHDVATPPLWYQYQDPQDIVVKVDKFLSDMKFFENLDTFADHVISHHEAEVNGQIH